MTPEKLVSALEFSRVLTGKWTMEIVIALAYTDSMRFNDIKSKVGGITGTVLTGRLKELESKGLVFRQVYPESPIRVEYGLTHWAREAVPILVDLMRWHERGLALSAGEAPAEVGRAPGAEGRQDQPGHGVA